MLLVAGRAIRSKSLIDVMDWAVVTAQAGVIAGSGAEKSSGADVAGLAPGAEDRVGITDILPAL